MAGAVFIILHRHNVVPSTPTCSRKPAAARAGPASGSKTPGIVPKAWGVDLIRSYYISKVNSIGNGIDVLPTVCDGYRFSMSSDGEKHLPTSGPQHRVERSLYEE